MIDNRFEKLFTSDYVPKINELNQEIDTLVSKFNDLVDLAKKITIVPNSITTKKGIHRSNKGNFYDSLTVHFIYVYDNVAHTESSYFYMNIPLLNELHNIILKRVYDSYIRDLQPLKMQAARLRNEISVTTYLLIKENEKEENDRLKSPLNKAVISIFGIKLGSANKWVRRILNNPNDLKAAKEIDKKKKVFIK